MAIERIKIEIFYSPEGGEEDTHSIMFDGAKQELNIKELDTGESMSFPVSMFGEIVDYLVSNGYLELENPLGVEHHKNFPTSAIAEGSTVDDDGVDDSLEQDDINEEWDVEDTDSGIDAIQSLPVVQNGTSEAGNVSAGFLDQLQTLDVDLSILEASSHGDSFKSANKSEYKRGKAKPLPEDPEKAMQEIKRQKHLNTLMSKGKAISRAE